MPMKSVLDEDNDNHHDNNSSLSSHYCPKCRQKMVGDFDSPNI